MPNYTLSGDEAKETLRVRECGFFRWRRIKSIGESLILLDKNGGEFMPKYVIEREIPGAGKLTQEEITGISQKSCGVLKNMGPQIQWVESYVTADKIYCVYIAPNEAMVREHAKQGGFPANRVSEVKRMIDPTSAEA